MGIVALSRVAAIEGAKYGIRSNTISPSAATRLAGGRGLDEKERETMHERYDPRHVSALVAWLARADCPATSQVFHVGGGSLFVFDIPTVAHFFSSREGWSPDELDTLLRPNLVQPAAAESFLRR
jgi:hypothetical protein